MTTPASRGEVIVRDVSRQFVVTHDRPQTLKERLVRRGRSAPTHLHAVRNVSFTIERGESVALVGRNGSGKSTLLKMLAGIIPPHSGTIEAGGTVASMLELGSGFHPDFTGRENVFMNGAIHGLSEKAVAARLDEIIDFAELDEFIDMPVRTYSSGMQMRLAFSVAAHVNPDILLLDEVLAVGDEAFQRKCIGRIERFLHDGGTLIFVSHAPQAVSQVCSRAILLESGRLVADGPSDDILTQYQHRVKRGDGHPGGEFTDSADKPTAGPAYATEDVRIADVRLVRNGMTDPGTAPGAGEDVLIEVTLEVTRPTADLDVAIHLRNSRSQEVLASCSSEGGLRIPGEVGAYVCSASASLPLQEDKIDVSAAVRDRVTGDVHDHALARQPLAIKRTLPGQGIVAVPVAWSLGPARPSPDRQGP